MIWNNVIILEKANEREISWEARMFFFLEPVSTMASQVVSRASINTKLDFR